MNAGGGQSDEHVTRGEALPRDRLSFGQPAQRRPREVELGHDAGQRSGFSSGKRDTGQPTRLSEGGSKGGVNGRIRLGHRHVVNECDRFGTHAQQVVDVHRHAIDANPAPLLQQRGDLQFTPHPVGGQGQQVLAKLDESSESAGQVHGCTRRAGLPHAR